MDDASEETKDALLLFIAEVPDWSMYLCDLPRSHYIEVTSEEFSSSGSTSVTAIEVHWDGILSRVISSVSSCSTIFEKV